MCSHKQTNNMQQNTEKDIERKRYENDMQSPKLNNKGTEKTKYVKKTNNKEI